jgi:hypothetical protein
MERVAAPFLGVLFLAFLVLGGVAPKPLHSNLRVVPPFERIPVMGGDSAQAISEVSSSQPHVVPAMTERAPSYSPTANVPSPAQRRVLTVYDAEGLRAALLPVHLFGRSPAYGSGGGGEEGGIYGGGVDGGGGGDGVTNQVFWTFLVDAGRLEVSSPLVIPAGADGRIVTAGGGGSSSLSSRGGGGGGGTGRAARVARDTSLFEVQRGGALELANLDLSGGTTLGDGAAVFSDGGRVLLEGCAVRARFVATSHTHTLNRKRAEGEHTQWSTAAEGLTGLLRWS